VSGKGKISLLDATPDLKDKVAWKWQATADTLRPAFGDPVGGTTSFAFCVYDTMGARMTATIPGGGSCGTLPCWKETSSIKYGDKLLSADGIQKITLKPGLALRAKIGVKGKGDNLKLLVPGVPFSGPVVVQLLRSDNASICWETTFSTSTLNDGVKYKA